MYFILPNKHFQHGYLIKWFLIKGYVPMKYIPNFVQFSILSMYLNKSKWTEFFSSPKWEIALSVRILSEKTML